MGILQNARMEKLAQLEARGIPITKAHGEAGYSIQGAHRARKKPEYRRRVHELMEQDAAKTSDLVIYNRKWIINEMRTSYDLCLQKDLVAECPECGQKVEKARDMKNAVKLLEMFGLEQGMFKRHLDVTSRKVAMIEGTQSEVLEKLAQLLERLGIAAVAQLLDRLGDDIIVAACKQIGYIATKENGRADVHDSASGDAGDAGDSDVESVPALPEAAGLSLGG